MCAEAAREAGLRRGRRSLYLDDAASAAASLADALGPTAARAYAAAILGHLDA